jgi:hypothetical protein
MNLPMICVALGLGLSLSPSPAKFEWQASYSDSMERAAAENRVVFVALDFENEGRCELFLKTLLKDKLILAAAERSLNLVSSTEVHKKTGGCPRFRGIECKDHGRMESDLLDNVLIPNDEDMFAMPQYLWLNGEGDVLLSVPFELDRDGMLWCFETAESLVNPETAAPLSVEARPPRRLLMGRAYEAAAGDKHARGMTPSEMELELSKTKSNFLGLTNVGLIGRLMFTAEPEAVKYVKTQLSFTVQTFAKDRIGETIHTMGAISPEMFWEAIAEFKDTKDRDARHEIAVALEQLGAADALKFVKAEYKSEKDAEIERAWVRAMGACGSDDSGVRKSLIKLAGTEGDESMRASAAVALGYLQRNEEVQAAWRALLSGASQDLGVAAACGAALARDTSVLSAIEAALAEAEGESKASLERVVTVLKGGDLFPIEEDVARITRDALPRERIFFNEAIPAGGRGGRGE